jgi:hypothetical protein
MRQLRILFSVNRSTYLPGMSDRHKSSSRANRTTRLSECIGEGSALGVIRVVIIFGLVDVARGAVVGEKGVANCSVIMGVSVKALVRKSQERRKLLHRQKHRNNSILRNSFILSSPANKPTFQ